MNRTASQGAPSGAASQSAPSGAASQGAPSGATPPASREPLGLDGDGLRKAMRHPTGAAGWLLQHRQGGLHAELSEALAKVLLACAENEKPAELTLKVRIVTNPDYPGQVILSDQIQTKLPAKATAAAYIFDQDAMRLAGELPGQPSIPLTP